MIVIFICLFGAMSIGILCMEVKNVPIVQESRQTWINEYVLRSDESRLDLWKTACKNLDIETWDEKLEFLAELEDSILD